jgi:hypothetical protein
VETPFLGAAYTLRSLPLSAQTCVNLYAEINESKTGPTGGFYGTPGLVTRAVLPGGEGRALVTSGDGGILYAVSGPNVYRIDSGWKVTLIGQLRSRSGPVSAISNFTQTIFASSSGWDYTTGTDIKPIPAGPANSILTFQDGYIIFIEASGALFGITALNDATQISPLDVATTEALPDNLTSLISSQREVWLLGPQSAEIWADTGAADFPFERIPGGVITTGIIAPRSAAYGDGSLFWVTADRAGSIAVCRTVGYQVEFISTHAIEHAMQEMPKVTDAVAHCYEQEGHTFYVIDFPSADITYAYDAATQLWARRAWRDSNGVLHRHRAAAYTYFDETQVVIDHENGTLYSLELDATNDAGARIYRERAWPLVAPQEMKRMRCDLLELVEEAGVGQELDTNPVTWLEMSYDGGVSFGSSRYQTPGPIGGRFTRSRWRRNGTGRRPVAKLATTRNAKVAWLAANVEGELLSL